MPVVIAGDHNALTFEDYSAEQLDSITRIKKQNGRELPVNELTTVMKERGYVDCWQMSASKVGPLSTCRYGTRIDYIWVSTSFIERFTPVHTDTIDMIGPGITDHNMVVCSFE